MTRKDYMRRFSNCVRWRLSPGDAEDVINDYEELFSMRDEPEDKVCRDLGSPYNAARLLGHTSSFMKWTAVFLVLALSLSAAFLSLFLRGLSADLAVLLFVLCSVISLLWFTFMRAALAAKRYFSGGTVHKPAPKAAFPRFLPLTLLALCLAAAASFFLLRHLMLALPAPQTGRAAVLTLRILGAFLFPAGLTALVKSRTVSRRYSAVYALCLTFLLLCAITMRILTSMDLAENDILLKYLPDYYLLFAAGIVYTGVSLC